MPASVTIATQRQVRHGLLGGSQSFPCIEWHEISIVYILSNITATNRRAGFERRASLSSHRCMSRATVRFPLPEIAPPWPGFLGGAGRHSRFASLQPLGRLEWLLSRLPDRNRVPGLLRNE